MPSVGRPRAASRFLLNRSSERNGELAVGDFHWDGFDVGAVRTAGLDKYIEIFGFVSLNIKGENALASFGDALNGFSEMKFGNIIAIRNGAGKLAHPIVFRPIKSGVFGVGNINTIAFNHVAAIKSLFGLPDVAAGIRKWCRRAGLNTNH